MRQHHAITITKNGHYCQTNMYVYILHSSVTQKHWISLLQEESMSSH